jgi:hypothetical protein
MPLMLALLAGLIGGIINKRLVKVGIYRLHNSSYSNRRSKECRVYALGAVLIPLALATALLAWAGSNLRTAVIFGAVSVGWSIFTIGWTRNISRQRDNTHRAHDRTSRHRHIAILLRAFGLFVIVCGVTGLTLVLIKGEPIYAVLEVVWLIIVGSGLLLFIPIVKDN